MDGEPVAAGPAPRHVRLAAGEREHVGRKLFDTTIRQSIAYAEAAERAASILDHRPDLGADYLALADEILQRLKMPAPRGRLKALAEA